MNGPIAWVVLKNRYANPIQFSMAVTVMDTITLNGIIIIRENILDPTITTEILPMEK